MDHPWYIITGNINLDNNMMNTIVSKNKDEGIFCNSDRKQECP
jgi:hypothetical protein